MKYNTSRTPIVIAVILILVVVTIILTSCDTGLEAQSDNKAASFSGSPDVPEDVNIYLVEGTVIQDVDQLQRQYRAARGSAVASGGVAYGSYSGQVIDGKSYIRITITEIVPENGKVGVDGDSVILKVTDTKAVALRPGDQVKFKCRAQYEAVSAIKLNEKFNDDRYETWEFDYCRLVSPVIGTE